MHNGWTKKKENSATDCGPQWQNLVWMLNSYFLRNVSQFISIINENNPSIQVSGYLGLDTWILILSNYPMFGYMDSWISQFFMYPDTWIHGYSDITDIWILGYLDISTFLVSGYWIAKIAWISKYPDIQLSRYHTPNDSRVHV